jgi:large subunit ribosomal protein L21
MYAIVDIAGQQFRAEEGNELLVHRLEGKEGDKIKFTEVLFLEKDGKYKVGAPTLKATVNATIVDQLKGDKVIAFKKKRRKGFKLKRGHRDFLTKIKIDKISG